MNGGQKILVVDNDENFLNSARKVLGEEFNVVTAKNQKSADRAILRRQYAVAIIDMRLEGKDSAGFRLAAWYKDLSPRMGIILMSSSPGLFDPSIIEVDELLVKPFDISQLLPVVRNVIYKIRMPQVLRQRRFKLLHNLPGKISIKLKIREPHKEVEGGDVEGLIGTCLSDRKEIKWVVYNLPEHEENTFTIGVVSSIGCGRGCGFCKSGKRKFERVLTTDEIISQILHGLDSYHAQGIFREKSILKPYVNFTCEGDALTTNIDNTARAIEILADVEELGINFIITSIGDEKNLELFLKKYTYLPRTKHYWSVNSLIKEFRAEIMPATKHHSLKKIRDFYQEIGEKTGEDVTVSWMLIKGRNDTKEEIEKIKEFFGGNRPFKVKVQPLTGKDLPNFFQPTLTDLKKFKNQVEELGISCRIRRIVGTEIFAGCGTTIPPEDSFVDTTKPPWG